MTPFHTGISVFQFVVDIKGIIKDTETKLTVFTGDFAIFIGQYVI